METAEALLKLSLDFKNDPALVTTYQIGETLGWDRDRVRTEMGLDQFWEWAVYLNSPFSLRSREATLNGWLVHTVRSMMAPKGKKPKLEQSMFPFHKVAESYFRPSEKEQQKKSKKGVASTSIEVQHKAQMWRKKYEEARASYNAGLTPNSWGLYKGETLARNKK